MKAPGRIVAHSFAALFLLLLSTQGCSLVGLGIGAAIDSGNPDYVFVTSWGIDTLKVGEEVTFSLKDGSRLAGEFGGVEPGALDPYRARYAEYLAAEGALSPLPRVGDSVLAAFFGGEPIRPQVVAYGYNTMYFVLPSKSRPSPVRYSHIDTLFYNGKAWSGYSLRNEVHGGRVPLLDVATLLGDHPDSARRFVPLSDISLISVEKSKSGALTGLLIGLAVDVTIIVVAAVNAADKESTPPPSSSGTGTGGSCPFVYSYDGNGYVLDSETFSGAICQSLQRTDWDNLDHLTDTDGICSLKVENRLPETQYVDALKLLVVEHPQGSRIIADAPGAIHAIGQALEPVEAVDFAGSIVTPLVRAGDSLSWISNPVGRDPDNDRSVRDGLIVRFDRPPDADSARLILTLRNTPWSTEIEEHLLRLQGTDLDRWYSAMNESPEFRDSFVEIVQREAMLSVQVWAGDSWEPIRFIPFPGPYVEKAYVVPLDLRQAMGPDLRLRLESTVGFWVINSVGVDFTAPSPVRITEAPAIRAIDRRGNDVGGAVSSADERYHVLEMGDLLELAFSPPPARSGYLRSFVLESSGYYTVHVTPGGEPQRRLLQSFTDEPGAFGRYTLRILNGWLDRELGADGPGADARSRTN